MIERLTSREGRKWLYGISLAGVPLLVAYGVISKDVAPLWIAFLGALISPALALTHLSPPEGRDSLNVPEDLEQDVPLDTE